MKIVHLRRGPYFAVSLRWTRIHIGFKPWRRAWWQLARQVWLRWFEAWTIQGGRDNAEVRSTCVAVGPLVLVVDHPRPKLELVVGERPILARRDHPAFFGTDGV